MLGATKCQRVLVTKLAPGNPATATQVSCGVPADAVAGMRRVSLNVAGKGFAQGNLTVWLDTLAISGWSPGSHPLSSAGMTTLTIAGNLPAMVEAFERLQHSVLQPQFCVDWWCALLRPWLHKSSHHSIVPRYAAHVQTIAIVTGTQAQHPSEVCQAWHVKPVIRRMCLHTALADTWLHTLCR